MNLRARIVVLGIIAVEIGVTRIVWHALRNCKKITSEFRKTGTTSVRDRPNGIVPLGKGFMLVQVEAVHLLI
jgi:hypothetical protein